MRNLFTSLLLWVSIITMQAQDQRIIATNDMTAERLYKKIHGEPGNAKQLDDFILKF